MNSSDYLQEIEERLKRNFDIEHDAEILNQSFNLFAKSEIHNEKYFGAKSVKIWRAENYEYCFIQTFDSVNEEKIDQFQTFLIDAIDHFVHPHTEHMSSIITGVLVVNDFPPALEKKIKEFKYRKSYAFTFKGWAEVRLMVVNLHSNRVISNNKGKEVQGFYLPEKKGEKKAFFQHINK